VAPGSAWTWCRTRPGTRSRCQRRRTAVGPSLSANQTTSFFLVSGFSSGAYSDGAPGIDAQPVVRDAEVIEMLNLMCLAVIGVFLGIAELLGQDNTPTAEMAAEYKVLTEQSEQMQQDERK
jgi:hypothetical protein